MHLKQFIEKQNERWLELEQSKQRKEVRSVTHACRTVVIFTSTSPRWDASACSIEGSVIHVFAMVVKNIAKYVCTLQILHSRCMFTVYCIACNAVLSG